MFSKILVKLVDEAIVPALYLVTARIVSLVLISHAFGITVSVGRSGLVYASSADYVLANSYSLLFMVVSVGVGLLHIVIKSVVFHDTHIVPPLAAKLHSLKMHHLIQSSYHLYTQGLVWLAYLYFLAIGAGIMSLFGLVYMWLSFATLGIAVLFTYVFILDVEREL